MGQQTSFLARCWESAAPTVLGQHGSSGQQKLELRPRCPERLQPRRGNNFAVGTEDPGPLTREPGQNTQEASAADLPADWHLAWDERAAIMEYDGGLPRERAEAFALQDIIRQMQAPGVNRKEP